MMRFFLGLGVLMLARWAWCADDGDWPHYGRDLEGTRHSPLREIDRGNVAGLERAWTYGLGELGRGGDEGWVFECAPLAVDGRVYVITPHQRALCLDGATGERVWAFDPGYNRRRGPLASRGVAYWDSLLNERVYLPVRDGRIYALDAATGKVEPGFGTRGSIDLPRALGVPSSDLFLSSPPLVIDDVLVVGGGQPDGPRRLAPAPLAGFDAKSGRLLWTFYTIPQELGLGTETWAGASWRGRGGGNAWSILSGDARRGLVFVPTGAAHFDFYGGDRHGSNLFANCVLALEAKTGKHVWHFQTVRHDLWDYDVPAQPVLVTLDHGRPIDAVAQVSKTGFVYVLRRDTGRPVWPVEERAVPASDVPGESAAPTQPFPTAPPPFSAQGWSEANVSALSPRATEMGREALGKYRSEGLFTPPSERGSIVMPGFHGGANWSGAAYDKETGRLYVNTTELACLIELRPNDDGRVRYKHTGWHRLRDEEGYPLNAPPWGKLVAYDLNAGTIVWERPLGEFAELTARGVPVTGQENFGGPMTTASGLVFIASTMDGYIRAFDGETGEVLWKRKLDAAGYAAPVTYRAKGRQYVVICAGGGGKLGTPLGESVIAFALPED